MFFRPSLDYKFFAGGEGFGSPNLPLSNHESAAPRTYSAESKLLRYNGLHRSQRDLPFQRVPTLPAAEPPFDIPFD